MTLSRRSRRLLGWGCALVVVAAVVAMVVSWFHDGYTPKAREIIDGATVELSRIAQAAKLETEVLHELGREGDGFQLTDHAAARAEPRPGYAYIYFDGDRVADVEAALRSTGYRRSTTCRGVALGEAVPVGRLGRYEYVTTDESKPKRLWLMVRSGSEQASLGLAVSPESAEVVAPAATTATNCG